MSNNYIQNFIFNLKSQRNFECEIKKVLDEALYIEYLKDFIGKRVLPQPHWIDSDKFFSKINNN